MNRTIVVRRDYLHYVKKYARCAQASCGCHARPRRREMHESEGEGGVHMRLGEMHAAGARSLAISDLLPCRYEKRHSNFSAHCSPAFRVRDGDTVVCGQCRCVRVGGLVQSAALL